MSNSGTTATDAFKQAAGMGAADLEVVIVLAFFGFLFLIVAYIAKEQYVDVAKGGSIGSFFKIIIRAVLIVIVCSIFLI